MVAEKEANDGHQITFQSIHSAESTKTRMEDKCTFLHIGHPLKKKKSIDCLSSEYIVCFLLEFQSIPDVQSQHLIFDQEPTLVQCSSRGIVGSLHLFVPFKSNTANSSHNLLSPPELSQLPLPFLLKVGLCSFTTTVALKKKNSVVQPDMYQ